MKIKEDSCLTEAEGKAQYTASSHRRVILLSSIFFYLLLTSSIFLFSCGEEKRMRIRASMADSIMYAAGETRNYTRILALADSLEALGDLTQVNANRWRGVAYFYQGQNRTSEFYYKKAVAAEIKSENDALNYNKSARRLANMMLKKGDYEGALRVAMDALDKMRDNKSGSSTDIAILTNTVGCCLLNLGRTEQAAKSFQEAYGLFMEMAVSDSTGRKGQQAYDAACSIANEYLNAMRYEDALPWTDRAEELLRAYEQLPVAESKVIDNSQAQINLLRAIALQNTGQTKEAAKAFKDAVNTRYGKSGEGRLYANDYLMAAQRYNEAADNFRDLNRLLIGYHGLALCQLDTVCIGVAELHARLPVGDRDLLRTAALRDIRKLNDAVCTDRRSARRCDREVTDRRPVNRRLIQRIGQRILIEIDIPVRVRDRDRPVHAVIVIQLDGGTGFLNSRQRVIKFDFDLCGVEIEFLVAALILFPVDVCGEHQRAVQTAVAVVILTPQMRDVFIGIAEDNQTGF